MPTVQDVYALATRHPQAVSGIISMLVGGFAGWANYEATAHNTHGWAPQERALYASFAALGATLGAGAAFGALRRLLTINPAAVDQLPVPVVEQMEIIEHESPLHRRLQLPRPSDRPLRVYKGADPITQDDFAPGQPIIKMDKTLEDVDPVTPSNILQRDGAMAWFGEQRRTTNPSTREEVRSLHAFTVAPDMLGGCSTCHSGQKLRLRF